MRTSTPDTGLAADSAAYRLPTTVLPRHYRLTLEPDLGAATFAGDVEIDLSVEGATSSIVLNAAELDMFVGPDYLVTIPTVELLPVTRLFRRCEDDEAFREQLFSKGSGRLLYEILDDLFDYCFPILDKIGHKLDALEDDVFEGRSEEVVRDISNVKQEIISYRKIVKPGRATLRVLERHVERFLPEELELYFDDVVDAAERIWDILDNYKEVVEALEDTNESVISHRQNDVLRVLTVFSATMLPLTLITGFFGMNVNFPGFATTWAFWTIFVVMASALVGMLAFFRFKRWL